MQLNTYADDGQLYTSDANPRRLEERMVREVEIANSWSNCNGMTANPSKHQGMILGKTNYQFSFSTTDCIERFGVTLDNELKFKEHTSALCKKINNQFSVLTRFGKCPLGFCYGSIRNSFFLICLNVLWFGIFVKPMIKKN